MIKTVRNFTLQHATPSHLAPWQPSKGFAQSSFSLASFSLAGGAVFAVAAVCAGTPSALAEESLGAPIAIEELAEVRGGDGDTHTNSHNTTLTAGSTQDTDATNSGNTIDTNGGDVVAGSFHVQSGAFTDNRGMTNVVVNTAPQSNTQGIMTLNVVLH